MKYILLHGMGQNASSWDKTISFLPDNTEPTEWEKKLCLKMSTLNLPKETVITVICIPLFAITAIILPSH